MRKTTVLLLIIFTSVLSQTYSSESPVIYKDGERLSKLIHLKFMDSVTLPETDQETYLSDSELMSEIVLSRPDIEFIQQQPGFDGPVIHDDLLPGL